MNCTLLHLQPAVNSLLLYKTLKQNSSQESSKGQMLPKLSREPGKGIKRKLLSPLQQKKMDRERQKAIDTYRQLKQNTSWASGACVFVCVHVCVCVCACVCSCAHALDCKFCLWLMQLSLCVYLCVCVYVCLYFQCLCIYISVYVFTSSWIQTLLLWEVVSVCKAKNSYAILNLQFRLVCPEEETSVMVEKASIWRKGKNGFYKSMKVKFLLLLLPSQAKRDSLMFVRLIMYYCCCQLMFVILIIYYYCCYHRLMSIKSRLSLFSHTLYIQGKQSYKRMCWVC